MARRTLRTNLRFIGRRVVPHLYPADLPLPGERASALQRGGDRGFLALADAQPTAERRARAAGLVCWGRRRCFALQFFGGWLVGQLQSNSADVAATLASQSSSQISRTGPCGRGLDCYVLGLAEHPERSSR